jgi:hypothetical protein
MKARLFAGATLAIFAVSGAAVERVPYLHAVLAFSDAYTVTKVDDRLVRNGASVNVVAQVSYMEPQYLPQTKTTASSFAMRVTIDCDSHRLDVTEMTFFDDKDHALFTSQDNAGWTSPKRGTSGASLIAYSCRVGKWP